ncbi:MAG: DegQ family serine endoprotease [candidate division KSB1 bacterium]|nr:DegQ family serine endoprotease [candidate division KSB1 bacterium]MDZ7273204.1 DegQ family serine endoprotease [candidate division KSB1 bacterium]MDZ7285306.1 DegQ family serine endoprotease [candidate division KSB1 bacterium]MDZ7298338.1 DegQ family serine endoprotease [candidate division KSB1 bacterium]MDZ7349029.1 DegQ family serine endoprotease [candidate division KSB1 bacterium]
MKNSSKAMSLALVLSGVIIGALVFSHFNQASQPQAFSFPVAPAGVVAAGDRQIATLRDLNNAFIEIAEAVNPTVVTVFTEKVYRVRETLSPFSFFFDDPLRDFWGEDFFGPRPRRQTPPEREYRQQGLGSGVIVSAEGYILTNNHVIADADTIYIRTMDGRTIAAKVVGADPKTDIAVLKVEAKNLPVIKKGDSDRLRVGEWVLAIGSPLSPNLAHTVTQGIVSAKGRSNVGLADYEDFIQTDAAINPGNSGGALVNLDGELVGINTAIASRSGGFQGIGFAVPINMAENVMQSLIKHGKVVRGWLGVSIQDLNEAMARAMKLKNTEGALVGEVVENSPAEKAGFQEGDVILEMEGRKIRNAAQLRNHVATTAPGTAVKFKILREGREHMLTATLGELPADRKAPQVKQSLQELLGFSVTELNRELAEQYDLGTNVKGVVVTAIDQASPAFRAGLRKGDLIRSVNRKRVQTVADFNAALAGASKGDTVLLHLTRRDGNLFIAFEL